METSLFEEIKEGLEEAIEIESGKKIPDSRHIHVIDVPDVKSIRAKTGLSQSKFAHKFGLGLRSVQNWEAQRCHPIGPASILLKIIDSNPLAVTSVLEG